jgi:hypothetical protein
MGGAGIEFTRDVAYVMQVVQTRELSYYSNCQSCMSHIGNRMSAVHLLCKFTLMGHSDSSFIWSSQPFQLIMEMSWFARS